MTFSNEVKHLKKFKKEKWKAELYVFMISSRKYWKTGNFRKITYVYSFAKTRIFVALQICIIDNHQWNNWQLQPVFILECNFQRIINSLVSLDWHSHLLFQFEMLKYSLTRNWKYSQFILEWSYFTNTHNSPSGFPIPITKNE